MSALRCCCAWCGVVIREGGEPVSHGICPTCSDALEEKQGLTGLRDAPPPRDDDIGRRVRIAFDNPGGWVPMPFGDPVLRDGPQWRKADRERLLAMGWKAEQIDTVLRVVGAPPALDFTRIDWHGHRWEQVVYTIWVLLGCAAATLVLLAVWAWWPRGGVQ